MRVIYLLLSFMLCFYPVTQAQNTTNQFMTQAQSSLEKKDYTKARYLFLQAYKSLSQKGDYKQAIDAGTQAAYLYYRENYYQEAFDLCRQMNQFILTEEQKLQKSLYEQRFQVTKERLEMYIKLKNAAQAQVQLNTLDNLASQAGDEKLSNNLLYTQAGYYYTFGQNEQGDAAFQKLINQYKEKKEYEKVNDCYRNLISIARKANNAPLMERTYDKYIVWTDSVKALTAEDKLGALQQKYDQSLQTIQEKDDKLSVKQYMIVGLITFVVSVQMEPTLNKLSASAKELQAVAPKQAEDVWTRVEALKQFTVHIQELSSLENTLMEPYEVSSFNVGNFSKKIVEKVKGDIQPEVNLVTDVPQLEIKTNAEHLEQVLLHLLKNAALYTSSGNIRLEFKRKGAHVCQFIITDNGTGIPDDLKENLFKPFNEAKDLAQGDGLGLPICALMVSKLNGTLSIDKEYKKGCRFVLVLQI